MRRFYGPLGAVAVASLILAVAGCGETVIDSQKTEELLQAELPKSTGKKVTSVDCPSGVEVKAGSTFTCTAKLQGGEATTVTLKIRNSDADLSVVGLSGAGNGSRKPNE